MPTLKTLSLEDIDATIAKLRARRQELKASSKGAQRKIATLAGRRERLFEQIHAIDAQIEQLRGESAVTPQPVPDQQRTRRRQAKVVQSQDAILECVKRHTAAKRATIIAECHLSPANASAYLRRLCQEGKLIRSGEKSATTYTLP